MTAVERNGHEIPMRYDRFGRMTQDGVLEYQLDANGNRAEIGYPGGVRAIYSHDYADREATLELAVPGDPVQPVVESASYLPFGPLAELELDNGLSETHSFDARYYPTRITVSSGAPLLDWQVTTDDVGNPTAIADLLSPSQSRSYGYQDYQYYLTSGVGPWGNLAWLYDKIGNRLRETRGGVADVYSYVANAASGNTAKLLQIQLGAGGTRLYGFDAAGYQLQVSTGGDVVSFDHDAAGQLGTIDRPSQGVQAAISYDGRGFLLSANELHPGLIFGDDFETGNPACWSAVVGGAGGGSCPLAPSVEPVYSSEGVLHYQLKEVGLERYVLYFAGRPVALVALPAAGPAEVTWLAADHLGTPVLASDAVGLVSWAGGFEPFGADFADAQAAGVYLRFPGQWGDDGWAESSGRLDFSYNVFRWYELPSGRYVRTDPLGFMEGDPHPYTYVLGNPLHKVDPTGLRTFVIGAGKLCFGRNCKCALPLRVLGEDMPTFVPSPSVGQCVEADAVYTAEGVLKIPDNYRCTFSCNSQGQPVRSSVLGSMKCGARPWVPGKKPELFPPGTPPPPGWPPNPLTGGK